MQVFSFSTIEEAIDYASQQLSLHSLSARFDAELLIAHATDRTRSQLFAYPHLILNEAQKEMIADYLSRRLADESVAYILGSQEFWSLSLKVTPDVLIPRPETEMLVEWTLAHLPAESTVHIADLGTGSGAIALALAKERPHWQIDAADYSKKALAIASENAYQLQLSQVNFYQGNWCQALPKRHYDVILSNPPYIEENDPHLSQLKYEPKEALAAGVDGLSALTEIIQTAQSHLKPNGYLVLEHGFNQAEKVIALLKNAGYGCIESHKDLAGIPRMIVSQIID